MHVDGSGLDSFGCVEAPDLGEQRSPADDPTLLPCEERQHLHLPAREFDGGLTEASDPLGGIDLPLAHLEGLLAGRLELAGAAQQSLDAGPQLGERDGLGDVVVTAAAEAVQHVVLGAEGRQHQDRQTRQLRAQLLADVEAIDAGKHDVEDHQLVLSAPSLLQPLLPGSHTGRSVAVKGQDVAEAPLDGEFVLHHQNRRLGNRHTDYASIRFRLDHVSVTTPQSVENRSSFSVNPT